MKACERILIEHERKTIGYLTAGGAYDAGFRVGFRAALEWVKEMANENFLHGANVNIWNEIKQELADDSPVSS